jgi:hypothetical protein
MVKLQGWVKWGLGNEPRNVILYFARRLTRKKLEEIGKEFTIRTTARPAVCSAKSAGRYRRIKCCGDE